MEKIAVDAMTSELGIEEIVKGVAEFSEYGTQKGISIILFGDKEKLEPEIDSCPDVEIIDCHEVIKMNEDPMKEIRKKKDASIVKACQYVKDNKAFAVLSPGNTGATVLAATIILGRIKPQNYAIRGGASIAAVIPTINEGKYAVVLDLGGDISCSAQQLVQNAIFGYEYYKFLFNEKNPKLGLLNIGTEVYKGTNEIKEAHKLLECISKKFDMNYSTGYSEPYDVFQGRFDVVATDGFTGNIFLKTTEAVAKTSGEILKQESLKTFCGKFAGYLLKKSGAAERFRERLTDSTYGGAVAIGLNGICMVTHGKMDSKGICNGLKILCRQEHMLEEINPRIMEKLACFGEYLKARV